MPRTNHAKAAPAVSLANLSDTRPYVDPAWITEARDAPGGWAWTQLEAHCAASVFARPDAAEPVLGARLALYTQLEPVFFGTMQALGIAVPDRGFLFDVVIPLLDVIRPVLARTGPEGCLVGLAGGPGVGKTTLSHVLAACVTALENDPQAAMRVSIDDFYLSAEERTRRGFAWRTLPGTHDLPRLHDFLDSFADQNGPLAVPQYDMGRDAPDPYRHLAQTPRCCVFDGAMVGSPLPGYDRLRRRLDLMIFLDAPTPLLKHWRFSREDALRARSNGALGYSTERMHAFWHEALEPSITRYVRPNRSRADLVIELGPQRRLCALTWQSPDRGAARVEAHPERQAHG